MQRGISRYSQPTVPVQVRLPVAMIEEVDGFRREQKHIPTRPGAIADLLTRALEALKRAAENTA
jgi:hypothetical protein